MAGAWRVGLRDPHAPERMLGMLELKGQAIVASSGDYERFSWPTANANTTS